MVATAACNNRVAHIHIRCGTCLAQVINVHACYILLLSRLDIHVGSAEIGSNGGVHDVELTPVQIQAVGRTVAYFGIGDGGIDVLEHNAIERVVVEPTI